MSTHSRGYTTTIVSPGEREEHFVRLYRQCWSRPRGWSHQWLFVVTGLIGFTTRPSAFLPAAKKEIISPSTQGQQLTHSINPWLVFDVELTEVAVSVGSVYNSRQRVAVFAATVMRKNVLKAEGLGLPWSGWLTYIIPRSWELPTHKLKSNLMRTQILQVLPLKPGVGQYIAMHATLTARDFFLANFYPSSPFTCIFSPKSLPIFSCVSCG